ncbi:MAG: hypothetical protein GY939_17035, partial [Actinomycetia bacterium]|nr:hypothetical protein [Actinomycetes bacterium]
TVAYDATSIDANTWEIYSEGTTSGATQARLVRIEREATAAATTHLALFADQLLRLHSGNSGTIDGGLGSNGQVTLGGTATTEPVTLYQPDGACTDCSQVVTADGPRSDSNPVIPTSGTQDCPKEIKFDKTVDGKNGQPYLCFSGEKFEVPETLQVINPPVIIHIGSSIEIDMENSEVNTGGSAADFLLLVHKPTSWNPARLTLKDATFNGLLYAPGRLFRAKNFEGNGVFVFGEFLQGRSGTIDITYDSALDGILDGDADTGGGDSTWGITDWQKVAPLP